jgi:PAS domain S-box-containing protein
MNHWADSTVPQTSGSTEALLGEWAGSRMAVYCRDRSGRLLAANSAFVRRFGLPADEPVGLAVSELIHPEELAEFNSSMARPASELEGARTHRWLTKQGWRWYTWDETPIGKNGSIIRAVGRDITRQRLAEELYLKLSRAVDQSPVSMVITDAQGRVQYVNPKFVQVSGHTLEDILDRNLPVLREGHETEESYREFWSTVRSGKEWKGELSHLKPDGTLMWESIQVSCLRNAAGETTNLLCMREDITERRRLQEDLRQAQKMESLGTLAGGIAHDFNNILAVMNGYAEISLLHTGDAALVQKSLREIKRAVQRASGLVRQILTFSRKADVHFAPLDLNQLVRDLVTLLAETFPRTVNFGIELEDGLPPLLADQNQIQQIVLNLCVNARDAMPEGGTITVKTIICPGSELPKGDIARDRNYACFQVSDTGTGMTPEVRARIFEPFFTTKEGNRGTGLGLAVVYGIVASHHGTIDVQSAPGAGSAFRIFLPLAEMAAVPSTAQVSAEFPAGTESILIVDDEDALRRLLETAFARKGYRAICACDGLEAIDFISNPQCAIDAVLLDINMPGASGLAVMKIIKACRPTLKVLVVSGHLSQEVRADFERLGQHNFLTKPYTLDDLGVTLRKILDNNKLG